MVWTEPMWNGFSSVHPRTVSALSQLMICRPPLLKSGHIGIKDAQCADMNKNTVFRFLIYEIWSILCSKFSENWPKCHHKWPNYWVLLVNRSKCVSEDSKIKNKSWAKKYILSKNVYRKFDFAHHMIFYIQCWVSFEFVSLTEIMLTILYEYSIHY